MEGPGSAHARGGRRRGYGGAAVLGAWAGLDKGFAGEDGTGARGFGGRGGSKQPRGVILCFFIGAFRLGVVVVGCRSRLARRGWFAPFIILFVLARRMRCAAGTERAGASKKLACLLFRGSEI